jgi:hypothetical protein
MVWLPTRPRSQVVKVGIVGGSDLVKIQEQLGDNGAYALVVSARRCCLACWNLYCCCSMLLDAHIAS